MERIDWGLMWYLAGIQNLYQRRKNLNRIQLVRQPIRYQPQHSGRGLRDRSWGRRQ